MSAGPLLSKKAALNRAVMDTEKRLGRLLLEGSLTPESAGMMTLLILKVRDLRAEMLAFPGPIRSPDDPPHFEEI